jgi:hypothetical protein
LNDFGLSTPNPQLERVRGAQMGCFAPLGFRPGLAHWSCRREFWNLLFLGWRRVLPVLYSGSAMGFPKRVTRLGESSNDPHEYTSLTEGE